MKKLLETILVWLIAVLVPYFLVAVLHGFNFNMENWNLNSWVHYIFTTLSFVVAILAKTTKIFE